jgi:hypothetical protein
MANQSALAEAEWPENVALIEGAISPSVYFTGIRTAVVDGAAHLPGARNSSSSSG